MYSTAESCYKHMVQNIIVLLSEAGICFISDDIVNWTPASSIIYKHKHAIWCVAIKLWSNCLVYFDHTIEQLGWQFCYFISSETFLIVSIILPGAHDKKKLGSNYSLIFFLMGSWYYTWLLLHCRWCLLCLYEFPNHNIAVCICSVNGIILASNACLTVAALCDNSVQIPLLSSVGTCKYNQVHTGIPFHKQPFVSWIS